MASERELLDKLIKDKLGKGKARLEVGVGRKQIDLVFEKADEVWLVEAKKSLNFEALGQVLTYEGLYQEQFSPRKALKLGIVCEEGDSEIEQACRSKGVKVFILPEKEVKEEKIEEAPICGVCGSQMVEEEGEYKCKTCEYFFGMSSTIEECHRCKGKFGTYQAVEGSVLNVISHGSKSFRRNYWMSGLCPKCREEELKARNNLEYGTIAGLIKHNLTDKWAMTTPYQLEMMAGLPKEFIDYCLGKVKLYFEQGKVSERKAVSLRGIWKGVEIDEKAIQEAKHVWEKELWKQLGTLTEE